MALLGIAFFFLGFAGWIHILGESTKKVRIALIIGIVAFLIFDIVSVFSEGQEWGRMISPNKVGEYIMLIVQWVGGIGFVLTLLGFIASGGMADPDSILALVIVPATLCSLILVLHVFNLTIAFVLGLLWQCIPHITLGWGLFLGGVALAIILGSFMYWISDE